jgi:hypothetical protein
MFPQKFLNSRTFFTVGRSNPNFFYSDISRFYSTKDEDSCNTKEKSDKEKHDIKSKKALKIEINGDDDSFSKFHKIHGNMTGMDKIDGMSGQTSGISSSHGKKDPRPEEGIYIYSGKLNLDKESEKTEKDKKSDKKN